MRALEVGGRREREMEAMIPRAFWTLAFWVSHSSASSVWMQLPTITRWVTVFLPGHVLPRCARICVLSGWTVILIVLAQAANVAMSCSTLSSLLKIVTSSMNIRVSEGAMARRGFIRMI